jgi:hypothetical protein
MFYVSQLSSYLLQYFYQLLGLFSLHCYLLSFSLNLLVGLLISHSIHIIPLAKSVKFRLGIVASGTL